MKRADYRAKARCDGGKGRALVSVFGNVDSQGDRVVPGAFEKSLLHHEVMGFTIPFVWSHVWQEPFAFIGRVTHAEETAEGLVVDFELDDDETARKVGQLIADGRVRQYSFSYDIIEERKGADGANELVELDLIEAGPTLRGANGQTRTLAKSLGLVRDDQKTAAAAASLSPPSRSAAAAPSSARKRNTVLYNAAAWELRGNLRSKGLDHELIDEVLRIGTPRSSPADLRSDVVEFIAATRREAKQNREAAEKRQRAIAAISLLPNDVIPGQKADQDREAAVREREEAERRAANDERRAEAEAMKLTDDLEAEDAATGPGNMRYVFTTTGPAA